MSFTACKRHGFFSKGSDFQEQKEIKIRIVNDVVIIYHTEMIVLNLHLKFVPVFNSCISSMLCTSFNQNVFLYPSKTLAVQNSQVCYTDNCVIIDLNKKIGF